MPPTPGLLGRVVAGRRACGAVLAGALALAAASAVRAAEPVELSVLTYNVHGLPGFPTGDAPKERMPRIAERLNGYDVVLVQEDFRYHDRLVGGVEHTLIERGNPSRFWLGRMSGLFVGSGLTVLARSAPEDQRSLTRESFGSCSGWFAGSSDCMATKGFLHVRLRLANGRELDFYTAHLEAGSRTSDRRTRAEQLDRLASRMRELSGDRPVVVGGDFNLRWDVPEDRAQLEQFLVQTELIDSGAVPSEPELWTRVDYLFYRSGGETPLEVLAAGQDREFVYEGGPLSDHPALFLRLKVR